MISKPRTLTTQYSTGSTARHKYNSTLTTVTQQFQTQQPSPRNYDPHPIPTQYFNETTPHNSPQQSSSNTSDINSLQAQSDTNYYSIKTTNFTNFIVHSSSNHKTQNIQPGLTINNIHSSTIFNHITSRNLSRPPLQFIPNKPLSYSLTSSSWRWIPNTDFSFWNLTWKLNC